MGEHFVLLVDRLITETTLEAVIESRNKSTISEIDLKVEVALPMNSGDFKGEGKLVECRICQEEDEDCNMETPCSCCGSLKYAHRKCVQKWCNEKGDTMCEICLQQFKPGYTAPPKLFHYGRIPMSFRGNWEITRRDIQNRSFITMVPNGRDFIGSSNYDDYASSNMRSGIYCRIVAIIFMVLLTLRHILPIITSGVEQYPLPLLALWVLGTAGIVLPVYVMMMAVTTFHRSRLQQNLNETANLETDEENADHDDGRYYVSSQSPTTESQ